MKTFLKFGFIAIATATLSGSCAKDIDSDANGDEKKYFDAWMSIHYPDARPTGIGYYIIDDEEGSGNLVGDEENAPYVYGTYLMRTLDGTISYYDDSATAKQMGEYDTSYYYGNKIWDRENSVLPASFDEALSTMREGGRRTVITPSWLVSFDRYDTAEEYLQVNTGYSHAIYTISVDKIIKDEVQWEIDSIENWISRNYPGNDSTYFGYYYIQTQAPTDDTTKFENDDKVYFNYIGKLLNGQVFDCTIKDTAKRYNLYSSSTTYEPTYMTWDTTGHTSLTMGSSGSSVIPGFSQAVFDMKTGEKGIAVFYSGHGYSSSSSGNRIPSYSPLIFELEMIGKEEEED